MEGDDGGRPSSSSGGRGEVPPETRDPRSDLSVVAIGSALTAALSVGLATAFLYLARGDAGPDVGPTAATLDEAFSTLAGAVLGLFAGTGLTAGFARRGSRMATGMAAGFFAYATVLVPVVVATGPSDISAGESLGFAFLLGIPFAFAVILGSMLGATLGWGRYKSLGGTPPAPRE